MDEFIRVRFRKNNKPWRVRRRLPGGIEFDEPDPLERTVGVTFEARSDATRVRMDSIRRLHGWKPGEFKLRMSVEDGAIMLRGFNEHALPEGLYKLRFQIEEMKTLGGLKTADVDHDGNAEIEIDVRTDERQSMRISPAPTASWRRSSGARPLTACRLQRGSWTSTGAQPDARAF